MVPSKTPREIYDSGKFCQKTLLFPWYIALLSISSCPPLLWARSAQMPPKCLPNVSQMPPKCLPNASQMPLRCLSDDSQMPSRSQMPLRCLSDASQVLLHCFLLHDSTPSISLFHDDKTQFWYQWCFLLYDSSSLTSLPWFFKLVQKKPVWGLVLGSYIRVYI